MLASRCASGFSYDFDLHSKVLRVARHTVDPLFLHCRWIAKTTQLDNIQFNSIQVIHPTWIALGSFVFVRCGGFEKALVLLVPATALSSRRLFSRLFAAPKAYRHGRGLSDGHIAMKLNKTHINTNRHN